MLYQQFIRVCEIDTKIAKMHQNLAGLYAERAKLLQVPSAPDSERPAHVPYHVPDAQDSYNDLVAVWQSRHHVKLPAFRVISKKLDHARTIMQQLASENPQLQGNIRLVAVPPFAVLKKVLDTLPDGQDSLFVFSDTSLFTKIKKSRSWSFIVVIDREFSVQVDNLQELLSSNELQYKEYDCGGLGVQELIAAELQGVRAVGEDGWTLLIKDSLSDSYVPCAKRLQGRIVFDIDDADCLLDNNFLQPAILAM